MEVSQERARFPLTLSDLLELHGRAIPIRIEVYGNGTVAFLTADDDLFAEGRTINEAKENLARSLKDELSFLERHRDELGAELRERRKLLWAALQ